MRSSLILSAILACLPCVAEAQWPLDGVRVCDAAGDPAGAVLVGNGQGGVLAAWVDPRTGYNTDIWEQGLDASGAPWAPTGRPITWTACYKYTPTAVADGAGGVLLAWSDDRCTGVPQIYATRLTSGGSAPPGWPTNGVAPAPASGPQSHPSVCGDGAGGVIAAWDDHRGSGVDVYAAHASSGGVPDWTSSGVRLAAATGDTLGPQVADDGAGGAFVAIQEQVGGTWPLHVVHVSPQGAVLRDVIVCAASGTRADVRIAPDGQGGALLAWTDARTGTSQIVAQRLTPAGDVAAGWTSGGTFVAPDAWPQSTPALLAGTNSAVFVAWAERRGGNSDVLAQALSGAGAARWGAGGVVVCGAAGDQTGPALAADTHGGVYAAWTDARSSAATDVYATRLDSTGTRAGGWAVDGIPVCTAADVQRDVRIAADGQGNAFVLWSDARNRAASGSDLYAQRLSPGGLPVQQAYGIAAFHRSGQTFVTWHCPSGTGWSYRVYRSGAPIASRADLSGATALATVADSSWQDVRLSQVLGTSCAYAVDSVAGPLATDQGLWVTTATASGAAWYAVTAQLGSYAENANVAAGDNAVAAAVDEHPDAPQPVFQRTIHPPGTAADVYALWTSNVDAPGFPAMASRPSVAFDCGVVRGAPGQALFVRPHHRGGDFTEVLVGSGTPGEWVLALDDPLPNGENTFWYGYDPAWDVTGSVWTPPVQGPIVNYTERRILYTLGWMRQRFPVDTARVYASGYSMGGIGSMLLAFARPDWIAAVMAVSGKFDFSYLSDPDTSNAFNTGGLLREVLDGMWGTVQQDFATSEGVAIYTRMDFDSLAVRQSATGMPPIIAVNGRNDTTVGWAEKLGFYAAMEQSRQGGQFFWDTRAHTSGWRAWDPIDSDLAALYAFRTDRSYPALSHCSVDNDPGDGHAASGDSVGTINGYVAWDSSLVDLAGAWAVTLRLRWLPNANGALPAPDSATVDVTPRRTRNFHVVPGQACDWTVTRLSDSATLQQGTIGADAAGLVTLPGVRVMRDGSRVSITARPAAVGPARAGRLALAVSHNPARGWTALRVEWPGDGPAELRVFDVAGRVVRTLWNGAAHAGPATCMLDGGALPPGLYLARARQSGASVVSRIAIVR